MPDQCDAFGRLRGEHFVGRVSDSVPNLLAQWRQATASNGAPAPAGAVVEARVVFRRFPRAGDLIEVHSGIAEVGEKTLRARALARRSRKRRRLGQHGSGRAHLRHQHAQVADLPQAVVDAGQAAVNPKLAI